jgi:lipoprotein signal peptidase
VLWKIYRDGPGGNWLRVFAVALAWGGAAGNLLDRIRSDKGVVDFIDIGVNGVRFWTFNVADSAVTVGAVLLAILLWKEDAGGASRNANEQRVDPPGSLDTTGSPASSPGGGGA